METRVSKGMVKGMVLSTRRQGERLAVRRAVEVEVCVERGGCRDERDEGVSLDSEAEGSSVASFCSSRIAA